MRNDILEIAERLRAARSAVAFTGAGISTESGIPDFRGPGGVWTRYRTIYYEEFMSSEAARVEYWRMKRDLYAQCREVRPNAGHSALARLEAGGRLRTLITQNIDGLHQDAGSRRVLELHGTGRFVDCTGCRKRWPAEVIFEQPDARAEVPTCTECGGILKPATVMFGQMLPSDVLAAAHTAAREADAFLAVGSSLTVEPAASLPRIAQTCGAYLVIINRDATPLDTIADRIVRGSIGEALAAIQDAVELDRAV